MAFCLWVCHGPLCELPYRLDMHTAWLFKECTTCVLLRGWHSLALSVLLASQESRTTAQAPAPSAGPSNPSYRQEAAAACATVPADFSIEAKAVVGAMRELIGSGVPGMVDLPAVMEAKFEEQQLTTLYGVKIAMQDPEIYDKKMALTLEQVALVIECIKHVAVKGNVS